MAEWDGLITVGRIARPHGLRGHVVVNPETDFPDERFRAGERLWLRRGAEPEAVCIEEARFHQGRPIVRFAGVASIDDAEALGRGDLRAEVEGLGPLPDGISGTATWSVAWCGPWAGPRWERWRGWTATWR